MYTIIDGENGERIECSAVVEEKNLNVVPKTLFVCDCYFDFALKWCLQKTSREEIYYEASEIMNETTFMFFFKKNL